MLHPEAFSKRLSVSLIKLFLVISEFFIHTKTFDVAGGSSNEEPQHMLLWQNKRVYYFSKPSQENLGK